MEKQRRKKRGEWVSSLIMLCMILTAVLLIRNFALHVAIVEGQSMEPGFREGDRLFVERVSLLRQSPRKGAVVVFKPPGKAGVEFIKRIVAQGGDEVEIKEGQVYVNGKKLEEKYASPHPTLTYQDSRWTLTENQVFLLGDNRAKGASEDSRSFGPVSLSDIHAIVIFRYWPLSRLKSLRS